MAEKMSAEDARVALVEQMFADPEIRRDYLEPAMVKKFGAAAKSALPSYEAREAIEQEKELWRRERDADKADRLRESQDRLLAAERRKIIEDPELNIREDEIEAVEKLMTEETIGSHRAAARLYRAQQVVAAPRGSGFSTMDVPGLRGAGGDEFKGIMEDPDAWARERTAQIFADFQAGRGKKWMD